MNTNANTNTTTITNKDLTLQREHDVWELRLRCWNQQQIAQHLGITQGAVSQILTRVRKRLVEQFANGEAERRAEQAEQLLRIAMEALEAWQQSKQQPNPLSQTPPQTQQDTSSPPESGAGGRKEEEYRDAPASESEPAPPPPSQGNSRGKSEFGLHEVRPLLGRGVGFLRIAIKALADIRAIWKLQQPERPGMDPDFEQIKMLIGIDYDHMRNQDGVPVPRKVIDKLMDGNTIE
jgi:hypothetical protein